MKYYQRPFFLIVLLFFFAGLHAQHKIIWDMALGDTAQQRMLLTQVNNVITEDPGTKIEVVFFNQAVYAMLKDTGYFKPQIAALYKKGVVFAVCNNSLKKRNIDPARVIPEAIIVPVAVLEIVKKQEEGRSYIKAGY